MTIEPHPSPQYSITMRLESPHEPGWMAKIATAGSAVLGLGNIGPEAAMPVMEGKAILFKEFGGVDAFPLCVASQDVDEIVRFCDMVAPSFGGRRWCIYSCFLAILDGALRDRSKNPALVAFRRGA